MSQRDSENFDIEDEFLNEAAEEPSDYDKFLDKMEKRARPAAQAVKKGKAAWSKLEEVLAERKLAKDLRDVYDDDL
jgi:SPX domain protein involved in polyphosphate accumulation